MDPTIQKLIRLSFEAKDNAYAPYSKFPVGAAVLCNDGTIFSGCNVENSSYSLGICAEKCAMGKAISEGYREFKAVAVSSNMKDAFITPCGSCRQFLAEFNVDMVVYMTKEDRTFVQKTVKELLPLGFDGQTMFQQERVPMKPFIAKTAPKVLVNGPDIDVE